jgi:preprotein translocase subunit SecD
MQRQRLLLALILVLVIAAITVLVQLPLRLGLDLQGGAQLTIQVKTTKDVPQITPEKLEAVKTVIEGRVNSLGVSEAVVQNVGTNQILVQLPGVYDPQEAERVLGGTAQLDFRREMPKPEIRAQLNVRQQELTQLLIEQEQLKQKGDQAAIASTEAKLKQKKSRDRRASNFSL